MPSFRCYFIDILGRVVFPADIEAEDLEAAKHRAFDILCAEDTVRSSDVLGIEIWQDRTRVYPDGPSVS